MGARLVCARPPSLLPAPSRTATHLHPRFPDPRCTGHPFLTGKRSKPNPYARRDNKKKSKGGRGKGGGQKKGGKKYKKPMAKHGESKYDD